VLNYGDVQALSADADARHHAREDAGISMQFNNDRKRANERIVLNYGDVQALSDDADARHDASKRVNEKIVLNFDPVQAPSTDADARHDAGISMQLDTSQKTDDLQGDCDAHETSYEDAYTSEDTYTSYETRDDSSTFTTENPVHERWSSSYSSDRIRQTHKQIYFDLKLSRNLGAIEKGTKSPKEIQ
jgi:hypothetical protein